MVQRLHTIFQKERNILLLILLLALINGLLYVFIVPPWQHYDEPNHFEYVWLLTDRNERPEIGDYDSGMRQAVVRSMAEHGFFRGMAAKPDLISDKPWIGTYSQLNKPVLYYFLASVPLRILSTEDVTIQLYAARLVSLALFLVTILAGWGVVVEITPEKHPLRFLVPLTMALLPAFVDLMTSVNNDVGAIAAFSIFLWGCVRLIRRGPSIWILLWVFGATGLSLFTKRTVFIALPLLGIALLFAILRGKLRKVAWGLMVISGIVGILAIFTWGDAALWYRDTLQNFPTRTSLPESPEGEAVFQLSIRPEDAAVELVQIIPIDISSELSGKPLTLGAWIWASEPIEINTVQLRSYHSRENFGEKIAVDETPRFYALTFTPAGNTARSWVLLEPGKHLTVDSPVEVYYDGIVLAQGEFPVDIAPQFTEDGSSGTWGGIPFDNLLRNGSAESSWFYLRPWADALGSKVFSDYQGQESFSLTIYTLVDWSSAGWYYRTALESIFRTFWAKFAWGHVSLMGSKPYSRILLPLTILAFIGVGLAFWQRRYRLRNLPWDALFFLGLTCLLVWGITFIRGSTYLLTRIYMPVARYTCPVIIPTMMILSTGWFTILATLERWLRVPGWVKYMIYVGFFLALNAYSLLSIVRFYG